MTEDNQQEREAQWEVQWECNNCGCRLTTVEEFPPEIPLCPECGKDKLFVDDAKMLKDETEP